MNDFISKEPSLEDYWRGIILFGRNAATYKFALAKSLLELKPEAGQLIKLSELAPSFANHIAEHLRHSPKQITSKSSSFMEAIKSHAIDAPNQNKLIEETVRLGFRDVIDAFHVVGSGEIETRFYVNEIKKNNGIRITDEFSKLMERYQSTNLNTEVESRWRLVETAWGLGIATNLIDIQYDEKDELFFTFDNVRRRLDVTSSRGALNGYQKGKCFYCFKQININNGKETEVDHFFPYTLEKDKSFKNINGVWNLVLACESCNAGEGGKHTNIPTLNLLSRLSKRNNYLIYSHHPLRETILRQTGQSELERREFLQDFYNRAKNILFHTWEPKQNDREDYF